MTELRGPLMAWMADKCKVSEDIPNGELVAKAEVRIRRWDRDADEFKALSKDPVYIVPAATIDDMRNELVERFERIRALERQLDEVAEALAVLRKLGVEE